MAMPDDRLTTLEIRAAEQEKTIEELSGQIAEQTERHFHRNRLFGLQPAAAEQIADRAAEVAQDGAEATDRFLELEEQTAPDVPVTKPPHW
ncbi:MAG: hypothetical protein J0H31_18270 [Alphaproteobacteria bacterium]|nr:hypothetical protein [Alphaproteobacteria bacterium]